MASWYVCVYSYSIFLYFSHTQISSPKRKLIFCGHTRVSYWRLWDPCGCLSVTYKHAHADSYALSIIPVGNLKLKLFLQKSQKNREQTGEENSSLKQHPMMLVKKLFLPTALNSYNRENWAPKDNRNVHPWLQITVASATYQKTRQLFSSLA